MRALQEVREELSPATDATICLSDSPGNRESVNTIVCLLYSVNTLRCQQWGNGIYSRLGLPAQPDGDAGLLIPAGLRLQRRIANECSPRLGQIPRHYSGTSTR